MPKATRKSTCVTNTSELCEIQETDVLCDAQEDSKMYQESSSESEDEKVMIQSQQFIQPSTSQTQVVQPMYIPYIKGPKWTGLLMTACIIDFSSRKSNVKIF